ncbi:MAG: 3-hydroxyacyl-CoA dehydrogenase family protein, partial [Bryobacteraceae bacterium]
ATSPFAMSDLAQQFTATDEIVERCIYALVNEGAKILDEGIALRASDLDVVSLNAHAFPAWRGGPMFYADTIGLPNVLAKIQEFEKRFGPERWSPAPLLKRLAAEGKNFQTYDKDKETAARA